MNWFFRVVAPIALLMLIGIGAFLIVDHQIYTGLGVLALTVPLQWFSIIPETTYPQADGVLVDQDMQPPPLSVLVALGLSGLCFILAVATLR